MFRNPDGTPATWAGMSPNPELGRRPGVHGLTTEEYQTMPKAERDGIYLLNGHRFKARRGKPLPEGAVMEEETPTRKETKETKAPENRKEDRAPENRAAKTKKG